MNSHGIILFGHGARDPRWAEPFERLAARLRAARGDAPVSLFFGQGGHIRRDLPQLIDACRAAHPGVEIRCATAVGEDDGVLDAIARYCLDQAGDGA